MRITTIVGARPQFIKAASVSRAIEMKNQSAKESSFRIEERIIHTGQHYDINMSNVFFEELQIPKPSVNLNVGSGTHGFQTGSMLIKLEKAILENRPDLILVYGDTNSTLAGALVASKLHIPIAHVESGLRSFNRKMPEEVNRVLTDQISDYLFCPTDIAVTNLKKEGISKGVHRVGDVMYDSVLYNVKLAEKKSNIRETMALEGKSYVLATVHRAENTDHPENLKSIFQALEMIAAQQMTVILPLHPRTRKYLDKYGIEIRYSTLIEPVSYLDMLLLEKNAEVILTDSGGVQKEAYWFEVPCLTLRQETEWVETVDAQWNILLNSDANQIVDAVLNRKKGKKERLLYGDGNASGKIIEILL